MALIRKPALVGFFNDPDDLVAAAAEATEMGFKGVDAYSPYPIHGIEEVMKIGRSWIPKAALFMLFTGATLGWALQYWTHSIDYPINVGGRPYNAWPAYVVIIFESGILLAGITTFLSIFLSCRLFPNPFTKPLDEDLTNDRFCLVIPVRKEGAEEPATRLLKRMGADEIRKLD